MNKWVVFAPEVGQTTWYATEEEGHAQANALSINYPMTAIGLFELHTVFCAERPVVREKKVR